MIQRTLVLIKHDAIEKDVGFQIMEIYCKNGLKIKRTSVLNPMCPITAIELYKEHTEECFYKPLIEFMRQGITIAMIVEGENAISKVRELNGATDPKKAAPGTIRQMYGTGGPANAVHGSADEKSAKREIEIFF